MRQRFTNPVSRLRLPARRRVRSGTAQRPEHRSPPLRRRALLINPRLTYGTRGRILLRVYFFQVGLAAVSLMLALWAADLLTGDSVARAVLVAAIASTAFILFIGPHNVTAQPRHSIGGHAVAVAAASLVYFVVEYLSGAQFSGEFSLLFGFYAALTVGLAMLLMALTDTEHAPAAGTALAVVAHGVDWALVVFLGTMVLLLAAVHAVLKDRLYDFFNVP
ncbi:MAG: HPP family protein [Chloroflexota bacterium]|nr:HPP family protein [Chloroflexota bacterium]MDE2884251.1 HPP family protein [Chloroflexota bacterium]